MNAYTGMVERVIRGALAKMDSAERAAVMREVVKMLTDRELADMIAIAGAEQVARR